MRCGSSHGISLAFLICFSGAVTAAEGQDVIHVDAGATAPIGDGSSWCSAFADLQEALEVASRGDKIVVAHGTYKPDRGTGDRAATFQLISGVGVHGGFAGCGALDPNENNPALYETILSGDLDGDDGPDFTGYDDNTYHVVTAIDVNSATALEGVTVTGGNADGPNFGPSPDSKDQGSAVNNYFGTLRLANCIFRENRAANHGTVNDHGGATLENCEFRNNFTGMWAGGREYKGCPRLALSQTPSGCRHAVRHGGRETSACPHPLSARTEWQSLPQPPSPPRSRRRS